MKVGTIVDRPKIYVLIGPPLSGKTSWTKRILTKDPSFVVISTDDIIEERGALEGLNYTQAWPKFSGMAAGIAKANFAQAIKNNANIIYDQTNMGSKKRKSILVNVPDTYEKIAVVFDVDTKELFRRNIERNKLTGKHIPEAVILNMLKSFTPVDKNNEGFDKVIRV